MENSKNFSNDDNSVLLKQSDFSINYILNSAGETINNNINNKNDYDQCCSTSSTISVRKNLKEDLRPTFTWLQYTRYKPPKLSSKLYLYCLYIQYIVIQN